MFIVTERAANSACHIIGYNIYLLNKWITLNLIFSLYLGIDLPCSPRGVLPGPPASPALRVVTELALWQVVRAQAERLSAVLDGVGAASRVNWLWRVCGTWGDG